MEDEEIDQALWMPTRDARYIEEEEQRRSFRLFGLSSPTNTMGLIIEQGPMAVINQINPSPHVNGSNPITITSTQKNVNLTPTSKSESTTDIPSSSLIFSPAKAPTSVENHIDVASSKEQLGRGHRH